MPVSSKVSFIIPAHNRCELLRCALGSCLAQTFESWEAVVIDDHSDKDDLKNLISSFDDKRIRYIKQKDGLKGEAAARQTGIEYAATDILITLDSDDINMPYRAGRCYELLNSKQPRLIYTRVCFFSANLVTGRPKPVFQPFNAKLLDMMNYITNPGTAFNRLAYNKAGSYYNIDLILATDYDQFIRMAHASVDIVGIDEVHVFYRKHPGAVTAKAGEKMHDAIMQIRINNAIEPFAIEDITDLALPELCNNVLDNPEQRALWVDDRWKNI